MDTVRSSILYSMFLRGTLHTQQFGWLPSSVININISISISISIHIRIRISISISISISIIREG